jgi:hypothetical protein
MVLWGVQMKKKQGIVHYSPIVMYKGFKLEQVVHRPGALDMFAYPSRVHNTLHYPDGRIVRDEVLK